jgi:hypothetical protein
MGGGVFLDGHTVDSIVASLTAVKIYIYRAKLCITSYQANDRSYL